jgi:putative hydrolase of the HAD superfamily
MPVRAITFDFWMTLFEEQNRRERHHYRVDQFCAATGAPWEDTSSALKAAHDYFFHIHATEQRTLMPRDAVDMVCDALSITLDPEEADAMAEMFGTAVFVFPPTPVPGALEAVKAAAALLPVGLISDSGMSPGSSLRTLMDRYGFTPCFRALTFSDEVGVAKPQAPMFHRTARALNVEPGELLHIGDLEPTDIAGIQAVGGTGCLFAGANPRFAEATSAAHTFFHWQEFEEALPDLLR